MAIPMKVQRGTAQICWGDFQGSVLPMMEFGCTFKIPVLALLNALSEFQLPDRPRLPSAQDSQLAREVDGTEVTFAKGRDRAQSEDLALRQEHSASHATAEADHSDDPLAVEPAASRAAATKMHPWLFPEGSTSPAIASNPHVAHSTLPEDVQKPVTQMHRWPDTGLVLGTREMASQLRPKKIPEAAPEEISAPDATGSEAMQCTTSSPAEGACENGHAIPKDDEFCYQCGARNTFGDAKVHQKAPVQALKEEGAVAFSPVASSGDPSGGQTSWWPPLLGTHPQLQIQGQGPAESLNSKEISFAVSCQHPTMAEFVRGIYVAHGENHGKPTYKKTGAGKDVMLYYWDDYNAATYRGWWFGVSVGGDEVWAFNPDDNSLLCSLPPTTGWKMPGTTLDPALILAVVRDCGSVKPDAEHALCTFFWFDQPPEKRPPEQLQPARKFGHQQSSQLQPGANPSVAQSPQAALENLPALRQADASVTPPAKGPQAYPKDGQTSPAVIMAAARSLASTSPAVPKRSSPRSTSSPPRQSQSSGPVHAVASYMAAPTSAAPSHFVAIAAPLVPPPPPPGPIPPGQPSIAELASSIVARQASSSRQSITPGGAVPAAQVWEAITEDTGEPPTPSQRAQSSPPTRSPQAVRILKRPAGWQADAIRCGSCGKMNKVTEETNFCDECGAVLVSEVGTADDRTGESDSHADRLAPAAEEFEDSLSYTWEDHGSMPLAMKLEELQHFSGVSHGSWERRLSILDQHGNRVENYDQVNKAQFPVRIVLHDEPDDSSEDREDRDANDQMSGAIWAAISKYLDDGEIRALVQVNRNVRNGQSHFHHGHRRFSRHGKVDERWHNFDGDSDFHNASEEVYHSAGEPLREETSLAVPEETDDNALYNNFQ